MKTKNTVFLLIIAIVVFGAIFYQNQKEQESYTTAAIPVKTIPAVTSSTIERITITAPDEKPVTLSRSGEKWYTNVEKQYEADQNAITGIFSALDEPIETKVVSTNPDSFPEYHLSETSGTFIQVYQEGKDVPALDLIVGKDGTTAFSTYVRMKDGKEVLNAKASLSMVFKRPDGWRNKQIFQFSGANATRIEATGTSSTFTLAKTGEDTWTFEGLSSGTAEQARVGSLANMLSSLRANDFIDPTSTQSLADFGLEPARQTIHLTYDDKSTSPAKQTSVILLIGNEANTPGDWYARRADRNDVFTIGEHVATALTPDPATLRAPEAEPAPAEESTTETESITVSEESTTATETAVNSPNVAIAAETTATETVAESTPEPTPAPTPEPTPAPTPEPTPVPTPEPTPVPTPESPTSPQVDSTTVPQ